MTDMQTRTAVHSRESQLSQRWQACRRDQYRLSAISVAMQTGWGACFHLFFQVSTPTYLSILITLFPVAAFFFAARFLAKNAGRAGESPLCGALGRPVGRTAEIVLSLTLLIDAQMSLSAFVSVASTLLPLLSRPMLSVMGAAVCFASLWKTNPFVLPRLGGWAFIPMLGAVLLSVLNLFPQGDAGHLFPLLGHGVPSILRGALFLCGGLGSACLPCLLPGSDMTARRGNEKGAKAFLPFLGAVLFGTLMAGMYAYLLPDPLLSEPDTPGVLMMLPAHLSSSIFFWNLYVCALLFLFLLTCACALSRSAILLTGGRRRVSAPVKLLLCVAAVPPAAWLDVDVQAFFVRLFPWRAAPWALSLLMMGVSLGARALWKKRSVP